MKKTTANILKLKEGIYKALKKSPLTPVELSKMLGYDSPSSLMYPQLGCVPAKALAELKRQGDVVFHRAVKGASPTKVDPVIIALVTTPEHIIEEKKRAVIASFKSRQRKSLKNTYKKKQLTQLAQHNEQPERPIETTLEQALETFLRAVKTHTEKQVGSHIRELHKKIKELEKQNSNYAFELKEATDRDKKAMDKDHTFLGKIFGTV